MTTETVAPHPAAAWAKEALDALAAALTALDTVTTFGGPDSVIRANGLLLALAGHTAFTDPAADYPTRTANAAATLVNQLLSAANAFKTIARRIELERQRAARDGTTDPGYPVFHRADFAELVGLANPRSKQTVLAGRWAGLPDTHPARPWLTADDLPDCPRFGRVVVLSLNPMATGPFEVADVLRLTRVYADDLAEVRQQKDREAERAKRAERERLERDPQWQIDQLRQQVAALAAAGGV
jgi:hypothetical protein